MKLKFRGKNFFCLKKGGRGGRERRGGRGRQWIRGHESGGGRINIIFKL